MQAMRGLLGSRRGAVRRMNHQTGPDADGVDSTPADGAAADGIPAEGGPADSIPAEGAAGDSIPADSTAGSAASAAPTAGVDAAENEADDPTGEPADHEVAAVALEPARRQTGEPRVDAALTLLDRLTELPVTEHAAVFEQVHAELTAVLGQLDPESAGAGD
jgi:hypothetical protein